MATTSEIAEALEDYRQRCNDNARLRKMLRKWSKVIEFRSLDSDAVFTVTIVAGEITSVVEGAAAEGAEVRISATSEDMADMFWGDLNPAQKYLSGDIKVVGSAEDVLRVDAMAAVIWVD
jgi:putative sterol carrier protein